ncbi:TRAP transporter small permease [Siminovitchia sediminis]|uniref:TRAP transporter small permease n=1 Tax=Siminovitchia sediminis TaxID=1274353 RepID=A0ABW4KIZ1_9BACI
MKPHLHVLNKIEEYFIGIGILIITLILFLNVVLRYVFNSSIEWAEEFTRYGVVWITFVGSSVCIYKGAHLGIDSLTTYLEKKGYTFHTIIIHAVALIFSLLFLFFSFNITMQVYESGQISPNLGIPMVYVYAAMPVGGALMSIRFIQQLLEGFSKRKEA